LGCLQQYPGAKAFERSGNPDHVTGADHLAGSIALDGIRRQPVRREKR
jgi:hypothetical protein